MKKSVSCVGVLLVSASACWGIINPNFTPKDLVAQADVVFAAAPKATRSPREWKLVAARAIKGRLPAERVLSLEKCDKNHAKAIGQTLARCAKGEEPIILFAGNLKEARRAYVHAAGRWLDVRPGVGNRWEVKGRAPHMAGTYAGGTDMLIRMSEYLHRDPDSYVPVSAGVRWTEHAKLGKLDGEVAGMAAVEVGAAGKPHLFVASSAGDRLYEPKEGEESFQDVTTRVKLDTKSKQFVWVDVTGDGLADLVSWDGRSVTARLGSKDGTLRPGGKGWQMELHADCTGLAACSADGRPGVLVSTHALPVLLAADPGGWRKAVMPDGLALRRNVGRVSPCVVADLDGDGCVDVLQPGEEGSSLWKGKPRGFQRPVRSEVATGEGAAIAAIGDFDGNGALDVFLVGPTKNSLWENDGKGNFTEVFRYSGSTSKKCPPGALDVQVMDLNHDGWQDLCLVYEAADLLYHFNRGFRSFAEEGEVRLPGPDAEPGQPRLGQRAMAVADFNKDGSSDLAVILTSGELLCCFNDKMDMPGLCLRLGKGVVGPVTASCWIGEKDPVCTGTVSVVGRSPGAYVSVRYPGEVTIEYRLPGKPQQSKTVTVEDGTRNVVLAE